MKKYLLLCMLTATIAQADIAVTWSSLSNIDTFTISDDLTKAISGNLPPDSSQSVLGCTATPTPINNGFIINCTGKTWQFIGSRVACIKGGGGQWIAPEKSTGAYLCGM